MRRLTVMVALALLLAFTPSSGTALPAAPVDNGIVFGGQWSPAGNTTASITQNFSELPAVVEVFTATWCENCVDVEHALDDVQAEGWLQQYHMHRSIGETQDPFGTDVLDQRWRDKYGPSSPPAVVFNGSMKKIGSKADDGTLQNEFTNLAKTDLGLGEGSTTFAWTPIDNRSGTVAWALDIGAEHVENATLNVTVFIVESHADFEEGSNGLGTYPHIVRSIVALGDQSQGSATVQLPIPFDGNDLEIHLVYEIMPDAGKETEDEPLTVVPDEEDTPALSFALTFVASALALLFIRPKRTDR